VNDSYGVHFHLGGETGKRKGGGKKKRRIGPRRCLMR